MKKVGIVLVGIVILVGVIYCLPKEEREILIKEKESTNTSLAFYLEQEDGNYLESTSLPQTGYTLNTEKSVCTNNTTPVWRENKLYLNNLKDKGTSCYLYFNKKPKAANTIISNSKINENTPNFSQVATTDEGMYKMNDSNGTSYYYRGAVENNYLKFGDYYWRIIRVNSDDSIRIIYDGTTIHTNGEASTDRQIGTNTFSVDSNTYNNNAYAGYMYEIGQVHGLKESSGIKIVLENWYVKNILEEGLNKFISEKDGFCGDREPSTSNTTSNGQGGTSTITTYYGGYIRLIANKTPSLDCKNKEDLYTINASTIGNQALSYPIGLITADEANMAGGVWNLDNYNYYLYSGNTYWTISPNYSEGYFHVREFLIDVNGWLSSDYVNNSWGIRPVINLKADVTLTGSGTSTDPYVVEGAA